MVLVSSEALEEERGRCFGGIRHVLCVGWDALELWAASMRGVAPL